MLKAPYVATIGYLIPAIAMPLVVAALISSSAVWYGEGWGALGAVLLLVCFFVGLASAVATAWGASGWLRFSACLILAVYLYAIVVQFL